MRAIYAVLLVCAGLASIVSSQEDDIKQEPSTEESWNNKWFPGSPGSNDNNPPANYVNTLAPADDETVNDEESVVSTTEKGWTGSWFPSPPGKPDSNPKMTYNNTEKDKAMNNMKDAHHGVKMGVPSTYCDDAKTNLTIDWDGSEVNYTCYENKKDYLPNENTEAMLSCETIPKDYSAIHYCMNGPIHYNKILPTFGGHRPLWPVYGEYRFLPIQRWLHSLEHGAIVMLYHPCANAEEVDKLRKLVNGCLFRHVITPYNLLGKERPLVLIAWGCRLEMSKVDPDFVVNFIKKGALRGPERIRNNGQFSVGLLVRAKYVSDKYDHKLCPNNTVSDE